MKKKQEYIPSYGYWIISVFVLIVVLGISGLFEESKKNRTPEIPIVTKSVESKYTPVFDYGLGGKLLIPSSVEREIKLRLRDPDSFKAVEKLGLIGREVDGQTVWELNFSFVSRNGFGGMNKGVATAYVNDGKCIDLVIGE